MNSDLVLAETNHDIIKKLTKKCYPTIADCRENKTRVESDQTDKFWYKGIFGKKILAKKMFS